MVRIRVEAKSDKIIGATIIGKNAGNMISEITLAMQSGTGLGSLAAVIHPYPTTSEAIRQTGDLFNKTKVSSFTCKILFITCIIQDCFLDLLLLLLLLLLFHI